VQQAAKLVTEGSEAARRALTTADRAIERLDGHEKTCAERWAASRRDMQRLERCVEDLTKAVTDSNNITRNGFDAVRGDISAKNKAIYERMDAEREMVTTRMDADRRAVSSRFWWFAGLVIAGQSTALFALIAWALSKISIIPTP